MIGIIGYGNMGKALVKGLVSNYRRESICVYDKKKSKLSKLRLTSPSKVAESLEELISFSKTLILAVKPQDIREVLDSIRVSYKNQLIISIAAGITTSFIEKIIGRRPRVVRVMPNLAAKVGKSLSGICKGRYATFSDLKKTKKIFESIGNCLILKENYINALTAISGSGPGYIFYFLYCLEEASLNLGFSKKEAHFLVFNTLKGTSELLSEEDDFLELVSKVASPGGVTEAALSYFEEKGLKKIIKEAIRRATRRGEELSR